MFYFPSKNGSDFAKFKAERNSFFTFFFAFVLSSSKSSQEEK